MTRPISLKLEQSGERYRVLSIRNALTPTPGTRITRAQVERCLERADVTIVAAMEQESAGTRDLLGEAPASMH